jgi:hypothetical protein
VAARELDRLDAEQLAGQNRIHAAEHRTGELDLLA